jgi:hypothetical protein
MNDEEKYIARTERMLTRWSGQRLPVTRKQTTEGEVIRHTPPAAGELDAEHGQYMEPARPLPVLAACDVLVLGAGPAGLSVALAAKRAGTHAIILKSAKFRNLMARTVTGQGAGVAAAWSLQKGASTASVNLDDVQAKFQGQGVRLH